MKIFDNFLAAKANNFTLVRFFLASSVIYTHCYEVVAGARGKDGLSPLLGDTVAVYAVDGFFFLSGFLVYPSLVRIGKPSRFLLARATRLWPALIVSVGLTVLAGLAVTHSSGLSYLKGDTTSFIVGNLSFLRGGYFLTGVNCGNLPCTVNGSLWTLPLEARCYLVLAALGWFGLARPKLMTWVVLPASLLGAILWDVGGIYKFAAPWIGNGPVYLINILHRLWLMFALGMAAYIFRGKIVLSTWVLGVLFCVDIGAYIIGVGLYGRALFVGYGVLCLGLLTASEKSISGLWPDYSYGMYIYAFPVMMALHAALPSLSNWQLVALNFLATLPIAALSWHIVEKPALELVRRHLGQLRAPFKLAQLAQRPSS